MQQSNWQNQLRRRYNDINNMLDEVNISIPANNISKKGMEAFPLRAPKAFIDRIQKGNPHDPLLKQILPDIAEESESGGFIDDPLDESGSQVVPGLLHKYFGRALLVVTGSCAIHCRYCFRRHFPYSESNPATNNWQPAINYLEQHHEISEIILSGGDPLILSDQKLHELVQKLSDIPHIKRIRIHSRIPIVLPDRINEKLLDSLTDDRLKSLLVVHVNHANELNKNVEDAIKIIHRFDIPVFNQSVLLKGVNDSAKILANLSEDLFNIGIIPYYIHMLDPVSGTAHFKVEEKIAKLIIRELHKILPGYLVPKLVREIAGAQYKIPVELSTDLTDSG